MLQCNCVITCISILDYFYLYKKMMPFDVLRVILWNLFHKITLPPIHGIKPHRFTLCTYGAYPLSLLDFFWRRGWDSNPCAIARKLISSRSCFKMTAQLSFSVGFFTYLPFLILASVGFVAFSGMTQNVPTRIAPGMRPSLHKICMRRVETPHFSAICETDK